MVADVHGKAKMLERMLDLIRDEATQGDRLVFLGDLIGRGPDTRGVLDLVLVERGRFPGQVLVLRGNHESMMLEALAAPTETVFWLCAEMMGEEAVLSYTPEVSSAAFLRALPPEHLELLECTLLWYEDENCVTVHGGCPSGKHPSECAEGDLVWLNAANLTEASWPFGPKPLIVGHSLQYDTSRGEPDDLRDAQWRPLDLPHLLAIDTGCSFGGPLTACVMPERRFIQVPDRDDQPRQERRVE